MSQFELPRTAKAGRTARSEIRRLLRFEGARPDQCEVAELLVGEVVTNAFEHGSGRITVAARVDEGILEVQVGDEGDSLPELLHAGPTDARGRGLHIVDRLAGSWGVVPGKPTGKTVWFALALVDDVGELGQLEDPAHRVGG